MVSKLDRHAEQLAALGHPVRLAVLRFVVQGGENGTAAGDIQSHVDVPASTLSHHLKRLVDAALLVSRTEGTFHYYSADYKALRGLTDYVWEDCCRRGQGKSGCC
jgi:ArsR family transcriptional regulator, arsenate/arsenite/antimonite-responsive transcriptional repressor